MAGWLRDVVMNNLLPGSFVLSLEHVLKLHKGVRITEIDFVGPLFELGDSFVDGEFDTKFSTVLVDFGLDLIVRIIALQFVGLGQLSFLSHIFSKTKWGIIS